MRVFTFPFFVLILLWAVIAEAQDAAPEPTDPPLSSEKEDQDQPEDVDEKQSDQPEANRKPDTEIPVEPEESEPSSESVDREASPTPSEQTEVETEPSNEPTPKPSETLPTEIEVDKRPPSEASDSVSSESPSLKTPELPSSISDTSILSPEHAGGRLEASIPRTIQADEESWTASQPVMTLHGYMRVRGEMQDTFWLGRLPPSDDSTDDAFSRFIPLERRNPPADCGDDCDVDTLQFANMRLRLTPQLNLSEDVRVKMMFDMFDNMVAGSTPVSFYGSSTGLNGDQGTSEAFSSTDLPPDDYQLRNRLSDSIVVRRAWGEVRNRSLGELRFGRMPNHWGLGIMNNAGNDLDDDFSSDIDRLMAITKIMGIYLSASYDFIAEGFVKPNDSTGLMSDVSQLDDIDQFTFTIARRLDKEEQRSLLDSGSVALNGGIYFSYREQDFYMYREREGEGQTETLTRLDAETFTLDGWGEMRWEGLRLGYEASFVIGEIRNIQAVDSSDDPLDILQFGTALEFEYRLLDEKLGIHFDTGFGSGDSDVNGLSSYDNYIEQQNSDSKITTFRFHPAYRIDLILWRSIMRQITGAYYFRPGINYDFIRDDFGQLFGARLNVLWSRAAVPKQTWGDDPDLGVEINLSLYWRSEDGPEFIDGYHAMLQWGILFPMQGLGYTGEEEENARSAGFDDLEYPNALHLLLGIVY